jgi:hypothetical protein
MDCLVVCLEGCGSHGWQGAFAQAAGSTTEHDFNCRIFSSSDHIMFIAWKAFCFVVYTYVIHVLQGFTTEDKGPFPCSTHMRHLVITIASLANHRDSTKSYDDHRDSPRKLACRFITNLGQWKAIACTGLIPGHSGLRCRSIYRTLELSYAQATCHLQARPQSTRHAGQGFAAIATRFMRANAHGMERSMIWHSWQRTAALPYTQKLTETVRCASLVIMVEEGAWTRSTNGVGKGHTLRLTSCLTFHIDNDDNANLHVWGACGRSGNQDSYRPTYM